MGDDKKVPRNRVGRFGMSLAVVALAVITLLLVLDVLYGGSSPYIGALTFLVAPAFLALGCALVLLGGWLRRRALLRLGSPVTFRELLPWAGWAEGRPSFIIMRAMVVLVLAFPFLGVMSYQGYHYTESNEFCGVLCHKVMHPEYAAYQQSPHARVRCVDCHIGEGASWFVKSKLSGARQVFHYAAESYSKPIPPAILDLRPARETCERCHWPEKFHGEQLMRRTHFAADEENTRRDIELLVRTGGLDPLLGGASGIHWHVASGFAIDFVASDEALQEIPWVRRRNLATGEATVFRSDGQTGEAPPENARVHTMDCMDCHNRPTHVFLSPNRIADRILALDASYAALPSVKSRLLALLAAPYETHDEAARAFREGLAASYGADDPRVPRLATLADEMYRNNVFPAMKANWKVYPDNIGHLESPGCFRCHGGRHVSEEGATIGRECSSCHTFLLKGDGDETLRQIGAFTHAMELEGAHAALDCCACHSGAALPPSSCAGCHSPVAAWRAGSLAGLDAAGGPALEAEVMLDIVECRECHTLDAPSMADELIQSCADCHGDEFYGEMVTEWRSDLAARIAALEGRLSPEHATLLEALRQAGPAHNPDASATLLAWLEAAAK